MIKCGMSEVIITPPLGNSMPGYFEDRRSTGVKDDLYAKALLIESNEFVVFIVIDCLALAYPEVRKIRDRVYELTGIAQSQVMISTTHTHTGPPVRPGFNSSVNPDYLSDLVDKAADAAKLAYNNRKHARIGFGTGIVDHISFNRRFFMKDGSVKTNPGKRNPLIEKPAGPIDPEVSVMRIDALDGEPIGMVSNFACHTDCVSGTEYSADYPGELSKTIKKMLGEHAVSLFMLGACGNINHTDVSGQTHYEPFYYKKMGRILAYEALKVREKSETTDQLTVRVKSELLRLENRKPTNQQCKLAQEALLNESSGIVEKAFARQLMKVEESKETHSELEIQAVRLGDRAVVGLPAEIFVEFGLEIKAIAPFRAVFINELCNGANGYVCTREAYTQGGYEPRLTNGSKLPENAGEIMTGKLLQLLNSFWAGN
ncbi:neutral/alkaline non-lysosomal ceramidase N-terminal domain-containing protein [Paenibacillus sp. GCM10012303]|uniref:neutral/alkaline non-lysosomal ceramidase N-terminal domain-containing protein n=1 Tax=Paenibacillus sp. GCM10012303 TaxID=3317340 RepID=UPI00361DE6EE